MSTPAKASLTAGRLAHAVALADLQRAGCLQVHTLAFFFHNATVYAVDHRCPHMGFPLHRGTAQDGVLTCHWHHARFDLSSGGTFDQWADDVRVYAVEIRDGSWGGTWHQVEAQPSSWRRLVAFCCARTAIFTPFKRLKRHFSSTA